MSTTYTGSSQSDPSTAESDTLFAATPVWERAGKKRRGFGGSKTARTAAPIATTETFAEAGPTADQIAAGELRAEHLRSDAMDAGTASLTDAPLASDTPMAAESPIYADRTRTTTTRKSGGMAPMAIAAGVIVLGGLAAAGWYATRDNGVTQLTPGGTATSTAALETAPMASAPASQMAANTATAPTVTPPTVTRSTTTTVRSAAPSRITTTTTTRTANVRTRPAPATSAADAGVNTSATLPGAPMPYSATMSGATAPTTVNPAPIAPSAAEPSTDPSASTATPSQPSAAPTPSTFQVTPPVTSDTTP
jgi:hypothetical protein